MSRHLEYKGIQISGATWAKVEYGGRKLKTEELYAVAELLDIDLDSVRPGRRLGATEAVTRLAQDQHNEISREVRSYVRQLTRAKSNMRIANSAYYANSSTDTNVTVVVEREALMHFIEDMLDDSRYPLADWLRALGVSGDAVQEFDSEVAAASSTDTDETRILDAIRRVCDEIGAADNGITFE